MTPRWAQSCSRRRIVRSEQPGTATRSYPLGVDQGGDDTVEHGSVIDPASMAAQGVSGVVLRAVRCADQRGELDPQGFDQGCWQQGHGTSTGDCPDVAIR